MLLKADADRVPLGAIVEVKAGEVIPVDGVVVEGEGYVDESSFTGELIPITQKGFDKRPCLSWKQACNRLSKG